MQIIINHFQKAIILEIIWLTSSVHRRSNTACGTNEGDIRLVDGTTASCPFREQSSSCCTFQSNDLILECVRANFDLDGEVFCKASRLVCLVGGRQ